jgi:cyclophilin family peptidyl-prolyl cis-trans isomerase
VAPLQWRAGGTRFRHFAVLLQPGGQPGLNYAGATSLGYAVFGTIVQGLSIVDEIAIVPTTTTPGGLTNVPVTDVVILGAQQVQ